MSNAVGPARLLSLAAHELATPAGVLGGCLKIVRLAGSADGERRERALAQAERSYDRLAELLTEMSELWRLEAGEATFNRAPLSVGRVLEEVADTWTARLQLQPGVRLHVEAAAVARDRVLSDPARLPRALGGLLAAVARHSVEGTTLAIEGRRVAGPVALVRVLVGEAAARPAAHQRIERVPLDEFEGGLGLALPIARRVIEADGGSVGAVAGTRSLVLFADLPVYS
jgi:signal transduction histidine kinase